MSFPVALQLFTVREECKENLYGTLKKIKEMGYDGVEFAGLHHHTVQELKEMLEDIGLEAVSAHVPYKDMVENPAVFAEYAELGCKYIVVPYLTEEYRPGEPRFEEMVANLSSFGKAANENGMTLLYHNHDFEFITINGEYALDVRSTPAGQTSAVLFLRSTSASIRAELPLFTSRISGVKSPRICTSSSALNPSPYVLQILSSVLLAPVSRIFPPFWRLPRMRALFGSL